VLILRVAYLFTLSFTKVTGFVGGKSQQRLTRLSHRADYVIPPDNAYGYRDANGTWNGVVGMVTTDDVEFGLSLFSFVEERMDVIDYLPPVLIPK
jgi:hypothetical protein